MWVKMKTLRRHITRQATFFVTVATYERQPILLREGELLHDSWRGRELLAWVVLPEHFHAIVSLGDESVSDIMHGFKITYSRRYRKLHGPGRVWQNRFWDHVIRDKVDLNRHLDYIHYNPVHHGVATDPFQYGLSSLLEWFNSGHYQRDWGIEEIKFEQDFGE